MRLTILDDLTTSNFEGKKEKWMYIKGIPFDLYPQVVGTSIENGLLLIKDIVTGANGSRILLELNKDKFFSFVKGTEFIQKKDKNWLASTHIKTPKDREDEALHALDECEDVLPEELFDVSISLRHEPENVKYKDVCATYTEDKWFCVWVSPTVVEKYLLTNILKVTEEYGRKDCQY